MRRQFLVFIAVGVAAAGAAAAWFYSWSQAAAEEERLAKLDQQVVAATKRAPIDVEGCQALLLKLRRDPRGADDARLIRGRARLMVLLGKPAQDAWTVIEVLVSGVDARPEDLLLGVRILERRHAETGESSQAFKAAWLAERVRV